MMKKNLAKLTSNINKKVDEFVASRIDSCQKSNGEQQGRYMQQGYGYPPYGGQPYPYAQNEGQYSPNAAVPAPTGAQQPAQGQYAHAGAGAGPGAGAQPAQYAQQYAPSAPTHQHQHQHQLPFAQYSPPSAPSTQPYAHVPPTSQPYTQQQQQAPTAPPTAPPFQHPAQPQPHTSEPSTPVQQAMNAPMHAYPPSESSSNRMEAPMLSSQAGYADAAVLVGGKPMLPPQAEALRPAQGQAQGPMVPAQAQKLSPTAYATAAPAPAPAPTPLHAPAHPNDRMVPGTDLTPPPSYAPSSEKVGYILRVSTVATCAVCGDLGVQPWFCRLYTTEGGGGVSEEYHADEASLLQANFRSIGLPVGTAQDLVSVFTERNALRFDGYHCTVHAQPSGPAILVERFANFEQMIQVYFDQAVEYARRVASGTVRSVPVQPSAPSPQPLPPAHAHAHPQVQVEQTPVTSLKFATSEGVFAHVVENVRDASRMERASF